MKIAIIGSGAVGTLFGGLLKANRINAVLFDSNKEKIKYIKENGIKIRYPETGKTLHLFPDAVSDKLQIHSFDYYIFCVKAYSTEKAAEEIASVAAENSIAVTFQNGMGNIENLLKHFRACSIAAGVTSEGATETANGEIVYGGKGRTEISFIDNNRDTEKIKTLIDIFNSSKLSSELNNNYKYLIWKKLIINAAINPLTAITRLKNRYIAESEYMRSLSEKIVDESVKIAAGENIIFNSDEMKKIVFSTAEKTGNNKSSMLQDIEADRKTEIDYISGALADSAEKSGIKAPLNKSMHNIIKVLELKYLT